ncbi:MAG: histidine kinase [Bacteroidales bacterium]|nr:histidine kinase [Bacteroidales bacterium]
MSGHKHSPVPRWGGLGFQPYGYRWAMLLAAFSAVVLTGVMVLGGVSGEGQRLNPRLNLVYIFLSSLVLFLLVYLFNFWIYRLGKAPLQRFLLSLLGSLAVSAAFTDISFRLEGMIYDTTSNPFYLTLTSNLAAGFIAFLVSQLIANLTKQHSIVLENERLQTENVLGRYVSLQRQVSPHFFFNSLNTLDGLIGTDQAGAHRYLHELAATYRYIIQEQTDVSLDEELRFTHSYIYIMQIRHGDNLRVDERVDPSLLGLRLPGISLQLLVENAIKHNVISQRHPLCITIQSTHRKTIRVSNPIQPKTDSETSAGVGLSNLAQRYRLLNGENIEINNDGVTFSVEIPLYNP